MARAPQIKPGSGPIILPGVGPVIAPSGTSCKPCGCLKGACCAEDGTCSIKTPADCTGTYQGDGTTCSPNPCPQPILTGACCQSDGTCSVQTEADCDAALGTYQGNHTDCDPNPCPAPETTCPADCATTYPGPYTVTQSGISGDCPDGECTCPCAASNSTISISRTSGCSYQASRFDAPCYGGDNGEVFASLSCSDSTGVRVWNLITSMGVFNFGYTKTGGGPTGTYTYDGATDLSTHCISSSPVATVT